MRARVFLFLLSSILASSALAEPKSEQTFRLDFKQAGAAIKGDAQGLSCLETCAEEHYVCAMLAGRSHQSDKRYDAAMAMYQEALELGYPDAAFELQGVEFRRENFIESFAWGQLAIRLNDPKQQQDEDGIRKLPEFMMLAETGHNMDETERAQAEELAATRIAYWIDSVRTQASQDIGQHLAIRRRINREYPRGMAINGVKATRWSTSSLAKTARSPTQSRWPTAAAILARKHGAP